MTLRNLMALLTFAMALFATPGLAGAQQDRGKYKVLLENGHVRVVEYALDSAALDGRRAIPTTGYIVSNGPGRIVVVEPKHSFPAAPRDQDPAVVNPTSITVKVVNDSVRVMEAVLPPGFKETIHTHPGYVMYIVEGGSVRLHMADGRTRESTFKAGDIFYSDPITHWAENTGTTEIRVMIVELRRK